jgi:HlyD family secretion protein
MAKKIPRYFLTLGVLVLLGGALTYAFWPRPLMVDIGELKRGPMVVTINEEGRTRVHDTYVVTTPVAGRLLRVEVEPGDPVVGGETVVAQMLPNNPTVLDARSEAQTRADLDTALAALQLARAQRKQALADKDLADAELRRTHRLHKDKTVSQSALDRAIREERAAAAALNSAEAEIAMRQAELAGARARLIGFAGPLEQDAGPAAQTRIPVLAPTTGVVMRVVQQSESSLAAGVTILEIGNIENDLEVLVELLSSDAVQVQVGDQVILDGWGGEGPLNGVVERIEPWGFTKVSALGVEEQRVNTIVRFTDPAEARKRLGHGFRVEARIVVWDDRDALIAPSSALFREARDWAVFVVEDGIATRRRIEVGRNNGIEAQVLNALQSGEQVILYPSSELRDGAAVMRRTMQ